MTAFPWDEYKEADVSGFISFRDIGDVAEGKIIELRRGEDFNKKPCPELVIETEDGTKTLTAGQTMLKRALIEKSPQVGDQIRIEYYANGEGKPGRAPAKLFSVDVGEVEDQPASGDDLV